ncbi:gem-associated protein 6 [Menidia menidia]
MAHCIGPEGGWLRAGPPRWLRAVGRRVEVRAGPELHRGWLLTVDPVSRSLVLVDFLPERVQVWVVLGHGVEAVQVLEEADRITADRLQTCFLPPGGPNLTPQDPRDLNRRRGALQAWLQQNRVPVEPEGSQLRVAGVLTIRAPYGPQDLHCPNALVLDRVQRLVQAWHDQHGAGPGPGEGPGPGPGTGPGPGPE